MESQTIILATIILVCLINIIATYLLFRNRIGNTIKQKLFQLTVIWCIPILGALLIMLVRKTLSEPLLSAEENRKARELRDANDKAEKM